MEFVGETVRKTGRPDLLAVEAAKTRQAFEIGKSSGLFYVPRVLRFDAQAGMLELERVEGLVRLIEMGVRKDKQLGELLKKAGQALAVIHKQLVLPDEMKHELPLEWMGGSGDNVFIHGDFDLSNVCFQERLGRLVILDWSAAPLLRRTPVFGSRYFDILWFVSDAFSSAPNRGLFSWDAEGIADAFIEGYATAIKPRTLDKLRVYWATLLRLHRRSVWYQAVHREFHRALAYLGSQSFLYYKLWRYGRRFS